MGSSVDGLDPRLAPSTARPSVDLRLARNSLARTDQAVLRREKGIC